MGESKKSDAKKVTETKVEPKKEVKPPTTSEALRHNILVLEKAVATKELRLVMRVLRYNTPIRRNGNKTLLENAIRHCIPETCGSRAKLLQQLEAVVESETMEVEGDVAATASKDGETKDGEGKPESEEAVEEEAPRTSVIPEVEVYLGLLVVALLIRKKLNEQAAVAASALVDLVRPMNRLMVYPIAAKVYSFYSLAHEKLGSLESIRSGLLSAHRTACLRHDDIGQATLLNLLLRNLLHYNLIDQAYKLVSKTTFPEAVSNNQFCRYLYYLGRMQCIQLDYAEAASRLQQSLRKLPENTAHGFRRSATQLSVTVQLLMGNIPERSVFETPGLKGALLPYLQVTQAVRVGDMAEFNRVLGACADGFKRDQTYSLILRLGHNVIKTGLRNINLSYSCISFADMAQKLQLESAADAELVCAKAIRDGVVDAVLDHEAGVMRSKETLDVYSSMDPQQAFHKRTAFCLDVHNEAVKAMRYPPDAYKKALESLEERQERERQEEELAKEIEEEDDEEDGI